MQGRLTLVQPSDELRRHGLSVANLDPAAAGALKDEIFGRYLLAHEQVCSAAERPADAGAAALRATACGPGRGRGSAARTAGPRWRWRRGCSTSLRAHQWEGRADGPTGPTNMPAPSGRLIERDGRAAA